MSDQLSSDLASLKIDRSQPQRRSGGGVPAAVYWLVGLGVAGYAAYSFGLPYLRGAVMKPEVRLTEVALHSPAQAAIELTSSGYVEPQVVSRVAPKVGGRVARLHVREGDRVKEGQLLLELEQADREAAIQSARLRAAAAEARVATARANLAETEQQARRQRALAQQGVAPAANADDLEARAASLKQAARAAEAEVKAAEAEVAALRVDLQYMRVVAPISGTVISKPPEVGEMVGVGADIGGASDKVLELADFSTLMAETDIPEGRLHMVKIGSPAEITLDAFPGRRYRGEAVEISPRVNRSKATVEVKVKFVDPADGVLPDMSVRVAFLNAPLDEAALKAEAKQVVPASAIAERSGSKVVFEVEDETVRMRNVTLGDKLGEGYVLLQGPAPGTRLVADPPGNLADGQRIKEKK